MFGQAVYHDSGAVAVRYPRGKEAQMPEDYHYDKSAFSVFGDTNAKNCIITYGREFIECYAAYTQLEDTFLIKLNRIKPIDECVSDVISGAKNVYFFEESIKTGSVGEILAEMLEENGIRVNYKHIAVKNEFVKQASVASQLKAYKLDRNSIINEVSDV